MPYIALAMSVRTARRLTLAAVLLTANGMAGADTASEVYRALGIKPTDVLTGTVLTARVIEGDDKQVVAMTTYFTGKRERADAVNVRLDVFSRSGDRLTAIYSRDFGEKNAGGVGNGDLQLVDLDMDGVNEIIASYDSYEDPLIEQRLGEVILNEGSTFRKGWSGAMEYDATRAARSVPRERRDRFRRSS